MNQLKDRDLGERLLIPSNMLRAGEEVFLDDFMVSDVENALQVRLDIVKSSGQDLLDAILGRLARNDVRQSGPNTISGKPEWE